MTDWPFVDGDLAGRIREFDWSATSLGPIAIWPDRLRSIVELMLASPLVSSLALGPERLLLYNDAAAKLYGDRHPDALGRPLAVTFADTYPVVAAYYDRVFAGNSVIVAAQPLEVGTDEGGEVFDAYLTPIRAAGGSVIGAHMTGFEIGARVRADASLRRSEQGLATILDGIGDAFYAIDKDWRFRFASRAALAQWNMRAEEVIGRSFLECFPQAEGSEPYRAHQRVMAGGEAEKLETVSPVLDRWVHLNIAPTPDGGLWLAFHDIEDRKLAEVAARESEARLAAAFESVPVGAAVVDLSGMAITSNSQYRRFLPTGVVPSRDPERGQRWKAWDAEGLPVAQEDFPSARAMRGERVVPGQEMLYTDDDGREIWTSVATVPTRDDQGQVTGLVTVIADIDVVKRNTEAVRESEERLRQFGEASQDVLWVRDADTFQWEYLTPAFETIYGLDRAAALRGDNMAGWLDLVLPEDREYAAKSIDRVRDGEWVTFEYRICRPIDGELRWLRDTDFPIQDKTGKVVRIGGIGHDITALKRVEDALVAAEVRQRILMEGIPQLVWRSCDMGDWTWASPQWLNFTAQTQEQTHGRGWLDVVHPDDRAATMRAWEDAREYGILDAEYRIWRAADSAWIWHHTRSVPVRNSEGRILEWLGTSTDIQNLRELQERQQVLVTELQHRTFNLMSVVRSTAESTIRSSGSLEEFRFKFRDRIDALARAQRLLSRLKEGDRVTFDELIKGELTAAGALQRGGSVTLDGPKGISLRSSMVQTFAMAMHELTTNALKYGALHQAGAHLEVRWRMDMGADDRPWLHVEWIETGVVMPPAGAKPTGTGQGRTLIEEALPYQLRARTTYVMAEDGVRCSISLPVSHWTETAGGYLDA